MAGGGVEEPGRADVRDVSGHLDLVQGHECPGLAQHRQVLLGDLGRAQAGKVLGAEDVPVDLIADRQDFGGVGGPAGMGLDAVERDLLERGVFGLGGAEHVPLDLRPGNYSPGEVSELEEIRLRVDRDVPAVDGDAGYAVPPRVERLGQIEADHCWCLDRRGHGGPSFASWGLWCFATV